MKSPIANQVALGRATVVVIDKDDLPHLLPMLTMTGISYLKGKNNWRR